MDTITVTPTEQQDYFKFPKEWIGKMNVQITATPIKQNTGEKKKFVSIQERYPGMSGSQIYETLHQQYMDSLTPEEKIDYDKDMARLLEITSKYPIDIKNAKKWIAESRGYQYEEQQG
jgi:hypothetical protein